MARAKTSNARGRVKAAGVFVLWGTVLGSSLAFIDGSAVNLAAPVIQQKLGGELAAAQWVINAYALMLGALVLAGGAAADRYGRKATYLAGVMLFATASAACGLAPNLETLIAARVAQGVAAALLTPASLALLGSSFEGRAQGQAIGVWAGASGLMAALGPVLGGWLVQTVSWRAVFAINLPLAALAVWMVTRHAKESHGARTGPLDWPGAATVTAGLGLITWALTEGAKGASLVVLAAGAAGSGLLAAFLLIEARAQSPMAPLQLFRSVPFSGLNGLTLLLYAAFSGALFVLPFELLKVHRYSASAAGAALLPLSLGLAIVSPLTGRLSARVGPRALLLLGGLLAAAGFGVLALRAADPAYWTGAFPGLALLALGMGTAVAPLTSAVLGAVPEEREGAASGINNAVARVAGLIAVALAGFVIGGTDPASIAAGYKGAMLAAAIGAAAAGIVGFLTAAR